MRGTFSLATILALGVGGGAVAGTVITLDQVVNGAPGKPQTMYLESDRLRLTSPESDFIFRGDQNKVWVIRSQDHSYTELTPESMGQMRAQMDQAMDKMRQQMASMPEAQRKQVEALMASRGMGQGGAAAAPKISYERAGEVRKVGDWNCTPYHMVMDGFPRSDVCIAKLSELGLTRDDMKTFAGFSAFMRPLGGAGGKLSPSSSFDFDAMKKAIGFDGFAVQTSIQSPDGSLHLQTTLKSIQHQAVPASSFDLPAGYTKQDTGAMGRPYAPQ